MHIRKQLHEEGFGEFRFFLQLFLPSLPGRVRCVICHQNHFNGAGKSHHLFYDVIHDDFSNAKLLYYFSVLSHFRAIGKPEALLESGRLLSMGGQCLFLGSDSRLAVFPCECFVSHGFLLHVSPTWWWNHLWGHWHELRHEILTYWHKVDLEVGR